MTYDLDDVDMLDLSDPTGPRRIMHLVFDPNHPGLCLTLSCGHVFDGPHPLLARGQKGRLLRVRERRRRIDFHGERRWRNGILWLFEQLALCHREHRDGHEQ